MNPSQKPAPPAGLGWGFPKGFVLLASIPRALPDRRSRLSYAFGVWGQAKRGFQYDQVQKVY